MTEISEFLTVDRVAAICHVHRNTVIRWIQAGKLVVARPGKRYLITAQSVQALLMSGAK